MPPTVLAADEFVVAPDVAAAWLAALPAARRARLAAWPDRRERDRSLLGTRLLREALRRHGVAPDAIASLAWSEDGRPSLPLPVHFSLAHCEGLVLCALSIRGPVGIDVEPTGRLTAADVAIYLTPGERAWAGQDASRFYVLWTRKEAVVKAAGVKGLRDLGRVHTRGERASLAGQTWYTAPVAVGEGFVAHLAGPEPLAPATAERLEATALM